MKAPVRLLVLILPLIGLAGTWIWTHVCARQGTEWEVAVSANGPRASLRGRYVVFRYDWGLPETTAPPGALCLEGSPPELAKASPVDPGTGPCRSIARGMPDDGRSAGLQGGVLYVPQEQVPEIRRQLANPDQRAVVRIRVNEAGAIIPLGISFRQTM